MPTPPLLRSVATAATTVVLLLLVPGAATGRVPSIVVPAEAPGAEVTLDPPVARITSDRATLELALGADAPTPVDVELALWTAEVDDQGQVTPGAPSPTGRVSDDSLLRPGEALLVHVDGLQAPSVLVATVTAADDDPSRPAAGDASEVAALLLPGPVGPPPEVTVTADGATVVATVTSPEPLVVSVRLDGAASTVHPDRLVLPDRPLELRTAPARWPLATEATVTDEAGRPVRAGTGSDALVAVAGGTVLASVLALVSVGRRRARATRA